MDAFQPLTRYRNQSVLPIMTRFQAKGDYSFVKRFRALGILFQVTRYVGMDIF